MKHILTTLLLVVAVVFSGSSYAAETIKILWGFNAGSNQANTLRLLIEELNTTQDKYTFVFASAPGAGGSIAAHQVDTNPQNTIVGMSSSFIIRPYYEKSDSTAHNLDNFTPVFVQGSGSPLFVFSKKYTTIYPLLTEEVNIGVSGIGSISHLVANEIIRANPKARIVNFKNMIDATTAVAGGHVDAAVGYYVDVKGLLDGGLINILGHTGPELAEFKSNTLVKALPETKMLTANYAIYASTKMDMARLKEIHGMITKANTSPKVLSNYGKDLLRVRYVTIDRSPNWYKDERIFWQKEVSKIVPK